MSELIVVSLQANHPSGSRVRGGHRFSTAPMVAEVTPDQRAAIKADHYMTIHRRLSLAWFNAFNIEHTETNVEKFKDQDPEKWKETASCATVISHEGAGSQDAAKTQPEASQGQGEGPEKDTGPKPVVNGASSQADCVDALVGLELVPGKDFDPEAPRNVLLAFYREEFAKKNPAK